jgi:glyoxylase-like metal-dependent hydrolase (beta-lactamase superfamily II)
MKFPMAMPTARGRTITHDVKAHNARTVMPTRIKRRAALLTAGILWTTCWPLHSLGSPEGAEYAAVTVAMPVKRVSEHVYYVEGQPRVATENEGFVSNAGFVVTGAGVVVFDALGTPALGFELLRRIREITDEPVVSVVLSHYHADHIYGLQVFEDLGAEIIAPYGASRYLESDVALQRLVERSVSLYPWVNDTTRLVAPDRRIDAATRFRIGDIDLTLNYIGAAHSDGDLTLYVEPDKVLFSGDILFEGRIPFVGNGDTRHWLETLERMETAGLTALIPGHGPASNQPTATISLTRRYLAYLREAMGAAVEDFQSFDSAYQDTDWTEFQDLPTFDAANRINAYQVYLSLEAEMLAN